MSLTNERVTLYGQQAQRNDLLCLFLYYCVPPCLSPWERWPNAARTERAARAFPTLPR